MKAYSGGDLIFSSSRACISAECTPCRIHGPTSTESSRSRPSAALIQPAGDIVSAVLDLQNSSFAHRVHLISYMSLLNDREISGNLLAPTLSVSRDNFQMAAARPSPSPPKPWERAGGGAPHAAATTMATSTAAAAPATTASSAPALPERSANMATTTAGEACYCCSTGEGRG